MRLYIQQHVFSWRDKFSIKDENGHDRWFAQGEFFSWGRKLRIYDTSGKEAAFIRQKIISLLQRYFIEIGGSTFSMKREITLFRPKFSIEGLNWKMGGDFLAHEYDLRDGGALIMSMSKKWLSWGDAYELYIPDPANELVCLCAALTIDCMNADANAGSHASN